MCQVSSVCLDGRRIRDQLSPNNMRFLAPQCDPSKFERETSVSWGNFPSVIIQTLLAPDEIEGMRGLDGTGVGRRDNAS